MPDRDRGLNARGRKDAPRIGAYLAHHALLPDRALVSAARRTRETWERPCGGLADAPPGAIRGAALQCRPRRDPEGHQGDRPRRRATLLVIGHNPGLHECALALIATGDVEARERLDEGLPTCGLVVIDFAGDDWRKLHVRRAGGSNASSRPRLLKAATD